MPPATLLETKNNNFSITVLYSSIDINIEKENEIFLKFFDYRFLLYFVIDQIFLTVYVKGDTYVNRPWMGWGRGGGGAVIRSACVASATLHTHIHTLSVSFKS